MNSSYHFFKPHLWAILLRIMGGNDLYVEETGRGKHPGQSRYANDYCVSLEGHMWEHRQGNLGK